MVVTKASLFCAISFQRKTRDIYKELAKKDDFDGYNFEEMFNSATNKDVTQRIIKAVIDVSGKGDFPHLHIEEALRIYFRSLRDQHKRQSKGIDNAHKIKCRRQIRLREKCEQLERALQVSGWDEDA
ncbi:uncharacterized protein LOC135494364 [Lineus longissimus]|uniref:uncharacterized protein LOC135494364 n=1 Tax=Lineus longissimus TaxID=88925 RepID=UPI00315D1786